MLYLIALYIGLADPVFEAREAATDRLTELVAGMPWYYGPRLVELSRDATEPEIVSRVRRPIAAYDRWRIASYVPSTALVWPICDAFPRETLLWDVRDRDALRSWYWEAQCGCYGQQSLGPYWTQWRRGTELMVRQMLRDGATAAECDRLMGRMWKLEQQAKGDCGDLWSEAETWTRWEGGYPQPK